MPCGGQTSPRVRIPPSPLSLDARHARPIWPMTCDQPQSLTQSTVSMIVPNAPSTSLARGLRILIRVSSPGTSGLSDGKLARFHVGIRRLHKLKTIHLALCLIIKQVEIVPHHAAIGMAKPLHHRLLGCTLVYAGRAKIMPKRVEAPVRKSQSVLRGRESRRERLQDVSNEDVAYCIGL